MFAIDVVVAIAAPASARAFSVSGTLVVGAAGPALLAAFVVSRRPALYVTDEGIKLVRAIRPTQHVLWPQIAGFEVERFSVYGGKRRSTMFAVTAQLSSGRRLRLGPTTRPLTYTSKYTGHSPEFDDVKRTCDELNADLRRHVPASGGVITPL